MICKVIILLSTLMFQVACAASFDCDKASGVIEKKICAESILSALDDKMLSSYIKILDEADKPDIVRKEQRDWLKLTRNKCESTECIKKAYRQRLEALNKYPHYSWVTFENEELGIRFSNPSNRIVRSNKKEKRITVYNYPANSTDHMIEFEIGNGTLEKAAKTTDIFVRENGKWISNIGTSSDVNTDRISGNGWKGIRAVVSCGVVDEESGIRATGECLWAIVSNGSQYVVAHTNGSVEIDGRLLKILSSLSFINSK